jgi:DNA-binding NarL/FixJ family response regulator
MLLTALRQARVEGSAVRRRQQPHGSLELRIQPLTVHFGVARWLVHCTEQTEPGLPEAWPGLLSRRQQEVADAVLRGWDNRLIAAELGCAEATVKKHLQSVFDKLGLPSRQALIAQALAAERGQKTSED